MSVAMPMPMQTLGAFVIPPDHPCLPGHFPGDPLAPGMVLLDEALALVLAARPGARIDAITAAKFSAPVRPGQTVAVRADVGAGRADVSAGRAGVSAGRAAFECMVGSVVVARGTVRLTEAP